MKLTRRTLLQGAGASLALTATGARPSWASTTLEFGTMQVQTFSDGYLSLPRDFVFSTMPKDELAPILERHNVAPARTIRC